MVSARAKGKEKKGKKVFAQQTAFRGMGQGDMYPLDVIPVDGPNVTAADLLTRIRLNNGKLVVGDDPNTEYVQVARANPALFTIAPVKAGLIQITEVVGVVGSSGSMLGTLIKPAGASADYSRYVIYAGLAFLILAGVKAFRG